MTSPGKANPPVWGPLLIEAVKNLAVDSGVVSFAIRAGTNFFQDNTKNWARDVHKNRLVKIVSGSGAGQLAVIAGNTNDGLITKGSWPRGLDTTSTYIIFGEDLATLFGTGSGAVYVNANTATNDNPRRFETTRRVLAWALISVVTNGQVFGNAAGQTFPLAAAGTAGLGRVDLSTLYFANQTAGLNGTVYILGVED